MPDSRLQAALAATYALPPAPDALDGNQQQTNKQRQQTNNDNIGWMVDHRGNAVAANPILAMVLCAGLVGSGWAARNRPNLLGLAGPGSHPHRHGTDRTWNSRGSPQ